MSKIKIFKGNADIEKTAIMNWRTRRHESISNMQVIADGYYQAAILLVEQTLKDNWDHKADGLIFPILFNFNHAIENYLKSITWTLKKLMDRSEKEPYKSKHDLDKLLESCMHLVSQFEGNKAKNLLVSTKMYTDELYQTIGIPKNLSTEQVRYDIKGKEELIHDITFARFALTQDLRPQFYITATDNVSIDLESLFSVIKAVNRELSGLAAHYQHCLDYKSDMESEMSGWD